MIKKKIFFITSYLESEKDLKYSLQKLRGIQNLKVKEQSEFIQEIKKSNDKFIVTLCSFEIIPSELNNDSKDSSTKLYKVFISLKDDKNYTFKRYISFNKNNNNFIYDFKFDDNIGFFTDTPPPISINFTGYEQFKLFLNYLKENEILINEELGLDLINDSYNHIFKANFAMDFFMEIFKAYYSQKEIKLFLIGFKLENSYIPNDFNYQNYSKIIDLIDKNQKIIIRHFREKDDIFKYLVLY